MAVDLLTQLQNIKQNLRKMIAQVDKLRNENSRLRKENESLASELDGQRKKIEKLENKNLNLHLTRKFEGSSKGNTELKRMLDEYIQEIDDCIARLKGNTDMT